MRNVNNTYLNQARVILNDKKINVSNKRLRRLAYLDVHQLNYKLFSLYNIYKKIITKDEAPPENNWSKTICEAPPKTIKDIPIVSMGLNPISIERTPNIKPNGTTGIISGLTSKIPFKKTLNLLFILESFY